jgi:hypothetical protein
MEINTVLPIAMIFRGIFGIHRGIPRFLGEPITMSCGILAEKPCPARSSFIVEGKNARR